MKYQKVTTSADTLKAYVVNKPKKQYNGISPSALGGCMRSHYWAVKGVEMTTPPNYGALVNFEVGHAWEAMMAKAFEAEGTLVKWFKDGEDKPFYDEETMLTGTPDFIVNKGELEIVDSKTVNSAYFRYAKNYKKFDDWVQDNKNYVYQQVAYVILAQKNGYPEINKATLSFASKDDGFIGLEFQIDVTDDLIEAVTSRALKLKGYIQRNELPPCSCEGWKIGYCNFGNPKTQQPNAKKKIINTTCCEPDVVLGGSQ